jgi:hypothetical protein
MLYLETPGVRDPADLLPHLHQLEGTTTSHLSLPIYPHVSNLLLVHALCYLRLKPVSIQ